MTKEDLENYEPKGDLKGFPKEIIARMLQCQEEQGNKRDIYVFENNIRASAYYNGFYWDKTKENFWFWNEVITGKNFNFFFEKYPKQINQDNSCEFKVGDEVIDIISGVRGKITCIDTLPKNGYPISVTFNDNEVASFTLDGRYYNSDKYPRLLHYREDYNYDVIDFNNLPKRQEYKESNKTKDNSQKFRVGDKVINIILNFKGEIKSNCNLEINFEGESCLTEHFKTLKRTCLHHYRDDCNDDVTDSNNLPKRQESKRWRAKKGWTYYSFTFDFKVVDFYDTRRSLDNKAYNSGNYFQTKEEAQEVADKLNKYFQELIKRKGETYKRKGETYYCFTSNFEVEDFYDDDDIFDKKTYKLGNYFKTKEEAQEVADKLNTYFKQLIKEEHEKYNE